MNRPAKPVGPETPATTDRQTLPGLDLASEQRRVDEVVREISKRIQALEQRASHLQSQVVESKRTFWEDVTVNLEDADEAIETAASIRQQAEVLSEQERSHRDAASQLKTLRRMESSPYFGRIDFREEGQSESEAIYIGISSFVDDGDDFLVYDWRAPVSSLYYDYAPGPAEYTAPAGRIRGVMDVKRQYLIRGGQIRSLFDTGITIGDEMLQEALGQHADAHMKSIVATIQRDQNRIIRDTRSRLLLVQGAAGSGKTSAALQRIAYLLYRYRESLRAEHVVLFSPNALFGSYISTVLPELGEENMQQTTFQAYLDHAVGSAFAVEDAFDQLEYVLTPPADLEDCKRYDARVAGIRFKASFAFQNLLDRYADWLLKDGMIFRSLRFRGRTLIPAKAIKRQFYLCEPQVNLPNRVQQVRRWMMQELKALAVRERGERWVDEAIELLDKDTFVDAYQALRHQNQFTKTSFNDFDAERNYLAQVVVDRQFRKLRAGVRKLRFLDVPAIYRQLFNPGYAQHLISPRHLPEDWDAICADTRERLAAGKMGFEDATPFVYLKERIEGVRRNTLVRHVVLDEAQDYAPFQFALLKRLFPHARMTVLGDLNQSIHLQSAGGAGFDAVKSLFPEAETATYELIRSYRSTRPIVEFAAALLAGPQRIDPFDRPGPLPVLTRVPDAARLASAAVAAVRELQQQGNRTVAVLCKTAAESAAAFDAIRKELPDARLVTKETTAYHTGIVVVPVYLAKGVEFDGVVLWDVSDPRYNQEHERLLLYTGCTRAMHGLHLLSSGEPSRFLAHVDPAKFELRRTSFPDGQEE
ncbi:MAG: AAA family ATPase [Alicyclobacillus sp.]|nr:AAA family ATPase [Alicyclobacillus sp.]